MSDIGDPVIDRWTQRDTGWRVPPPDPRFPEPEPYDGLFREGSGRFPQSSVPLPTGIDRASQGLPPIEGRQAGEPDEPKASVFMPRSLPTGLYYDGEPLYTRTRGWYSPRGMQGWGQQTGGARSALRGGNGQGLPQPDLARIDRYFGGMMGDQFGDGTRDPATGRNMAWDEYLGTSLLDLSDAEWVAYENTEDELILDLLMTGNTIGHFYDRALTMSREDPQLFTQFQMQLVQHGFMSQEFIFGEMDGATMDAIQALINGKLMVGDDKNFTEYLADARRGYFDRTFTSSVDELAEFDADAANALRTLREEIENIDFNMELSNPESLKQNMQDRAIATLGRRLTEDELALIVADVHEQERRDFYTNNPALRDYRRRVEEFEKLKTTIAEERDLVMNGGGNGDLDRFMNALMIQESGGDPNAVNSYSGAFGMFQFMPATWDGVTRNAGLDPTDKSRENQIRAARYLISQYYTQFDGDWRKVAIAWYAGPRATNWSDRSLNRPQKNNHPSIASYADEVLALMNGTHRIQQSARPKLGSNLSPRELAMWARSQRNPIEPLSGPSQLSDASLDMELDAGLGGPTVYENVGFDVNSYLQSAVTEAGGPDADAYAYVQNALQFHDLLGAR